MGLIHKHLKEHALSVSILCVKFLIAAILLSKPVWYYLSYLYAHEVLGYTDESSTLRPLIQLNTEYAPEFTEKQFENVTRGMSMNRVRHKLGSPLHEVSQPSGRLTWSYAAGRDDMCGSDLREVWLSPDGRVLATYKGYCPRWRDSSGYPNADGIGERHW